MSSMRVLVVSEDQILLRLLEEASVRQDHVTVVVHDIAQLLAEQERNSPELIVIDLDDLGRDALRALEPLSERRCQSKIVLASSCNPRTLDAARTVGLKRGLCMAPTLAKPLTQPYDEAWVSASMIDLMHTDNPHIRPRDIELALENDELALYYQPLVDLKTSRVWGAEALLRWKHPLYGWLQPNHIIPLAEKHELIVPITRWVAREAMAQQALWNAGGGDMRMTVNVSAQVLRDPDFTDAILDAVAETGVLHEQLVLEITEGQMVAEDADVLETLTALRLTGLELAIDDFGTGYSSLGRLHHMPFSELKIDKSFVMDSATNANARVIVRAISDLGRDLDMTVIAEGVASREAWELVENYGCDVAQGFFIARPLSKQDFGRWMSRWGGDVSGPRAQDHSNSPGSVAMSPEEQRRESQDVAAGNGRHALEGPALDLVEAALLDDLEQAAQSNSSHHADNGHDPLLPTVPAPGGQNGSGRTRDDDAA